MIVNIKTRMSDKITCINAVPEEVQHNTSKRKLSALTRIVSSSRDYKWSKLQFINVYPSLQATAALRRHHQASSATDTSALKHDTHNIKVKIYMSWEVSWLAEACAD